MKDSLKKDFFIRRKKSLWFALARKSVSTTRNEGFVEKYVSSIRKNCFFWQKNPENGFHKQKIIFLLKLIPPNFNRGFQQQKKASEQKHTVSTRNKFPAAGMKDLLKNMFSLDVKLTFGGSNV